MLICIFPIEYLYLTLLLCDPAYYGSSDDLLLLWFSFVLHHEFENLTCMLFSAFLSIDAQGHLYTDRSITYI